MTTNILTHFIALYGETEGGAAFERLQRLIETYRPRLPDAGTAVFSQRDVILITYGDMVREAKTAPLRTLADFLYAYLQGAISIVHILPFFPYSSDDGFSVIDYKAVNPDLGNWEDVAAIGQRFRLMFDAVINHVSAQSDWFQGFLRDDPYYRKYFLVMAPGTDLSQVFRPRATPLLTPVQTVTGQKLVWTTFSDDQVDLNYSYPDVLLDVMETLLYYVERGAEFVRLDAIAFIWKEIGTSCLHLPQTHHVIQLMRAVLDEVAPQVSLITETNVPHEDNVSYFGDGANEAQMVYNFSLPPLTLHAFYMGNAESLSHWADSLALPTDKVTFFNFLASHDGIGVTPAQGILGDAAVSAMAQRVQALGGHVSYRTKPDGAQSPYELNITYLDALADPDAPDEDVALTASRFLAAQAIMLALRGVPGIYFHSLFGSRNWHEGVKQSGRFRTINREKLQRMQLERELADRHSLQHHIFYGYRRLLQKRTANSAFHPAGNQQVLFCHEAVFALLRTSPNDRNHLLCLHNVSNQSHHLVIDLVPLPMPPTVLLTDIISGQTYAIADNQLNLTIAPYQALWLQGEAE